MKLGGEVEAMSQRQSYYGDQQGTGTVVWGFAQSTQSRAAGTTPDTLQVDLKPHRPGWVLGHFLKVCSVEGAGLGTIVRQQGDQEIKIKCSEISSNFALS